MMRDIVGRAARNVARLTFLATMLGCGLAIAEMSTPDTQRDTPGVVDIFDPSTGTITRTNAP